MQRNSSTPGPDQRIPIGRAIVPVQFGEQVIVSLLYNHDANPVHHRPDHAIQWMLGLLSSQTFGGADQSLESAGPDERTYALGTKLLARQDVVVMPGIVLAAICYERFISPAELTVSITTSFTYPLLVPTKGAVEVSVEAYEIPAEHAKVPGLRNILIEAFAPGITGESVRLLKLEAQTFRAGTSAQLVFDEVTAPQFAQLEKLSGKIPAMPSISHPTTISSEDRRRYSRIVEPGAKSTRPITESAWQCKIPRVLTEVIDRLRHTEHYQSEVRAYYQGRADETHRREAIARLVEKERKYRWAADEQIAGRVEELADLAQHLYARQHTVFDPRAFGDQGAATAPGAQMHLDLSLSEIRLRRGIHHLFTRGRLQDSPVFMGEATVMAQPLVTRELANFLCEINYSFETLKLFEYKPRH